MLIGIEKACAALYLAHYIKGSSAYFVHFEDR